MSLLLLDNLFHTDKPLGKSLCSCAPSQPPAPDYAGAAKQQGQANVDAVRAQGKFNNPNVVGPYGNQTVTYGGGFDQAGFDAATDKYNQQKAAVEAAWKQWDQAESMIC